MNRGEGTTHVPNLPADGAAGATGATPRGSIIIPAHNEETVLPALLDLLVPGIPLGEYEVIVVPNGCTDATASVARSYPGVRVVEVAQGSKIAALNAGDAAATAFPRFYLDADVTVTRPAIARLFDELSRTDGALAGRPAGHFETSAASPVVRSYYRARAKAVGREAPNLWGACCYALSERGRARFDRFPDTEGDDYWIDQLFAPEEKKITGGPPVIIHTPQNVAALMKVFHRRYRGNRVIDQDAELSSGAGHRVTTRETARALARSVRGPRSLADAAVYAALTVAARAGAARTTAGAVWERDDSSRHRRGV